MTAVRERPTMIGGHPIHPIANIFPLLEGPAWEVFLEDVRRHGIRETHILLDDQGRVLDGRHRLRAAEILGLGKELRLVTYGGDGNPDNIPALVVSLNLHRRHLTDSQRAMVAAALADLRPGRPSKKTPPSGGVSTAKAAKLLSVAPRTVERARTVRTHGTRDLIDAVTTGTIPLATAAKQMPKTPKGYRRSPSPDHS
jgi:hypothetical protein